MKHITTIAALCAALGLASCDEIPGTLKAKARQSVREAMFDPDAARFRNDQASDDGYAMCGEVNGKNRMGAYVGFSRYVYIGAGVSLVSPGSPDFQEYYRNVENQFMQHDAIEKLGNACLFAKEWVDTCSTAQKAEMTDYARQCKLWTSDPDKLKKELGIYSSYR